MPFERADPSLGTLPLAFGVRPRDDQSAVAGARSSPSRAGLATARSEAARYYVHMLGPLLHRHELVLVDMRGTGHSRAIDCPGLQTADGSDPGRRAVRRACSATGSAPTGPRRRPTTSTRFAQALGYGRIALYGDSYGTFLAQWYAFRHGDSLGGARPRQRLSRPRRGPALPEPLADRDRRRCGSPASARRAATATPRAGCGARSRCCASTPRGVGPLLDAIAFAGYEPPIHNYVRIDLGVERLLRGRPESYRRLTAVGG